MVTGTDSRFISVSSTTTSDAGSRDAPSRRLRVSIIAHFAARPRDRCNLRSDRLVSSIGDVCAKGEAHV